MPLSLQEISRLCRTVVANRYSTRVRIDGVTHTGSGSEYAEVLLTVSPEDESRGPRTVLVQVRRADPVILIHDLQRRLTRALQTRPDHR